MYDETNYRMARFEEEERMTKEIEALAKTLADNLAAECGRVIAGMRDNRRETHAILEVPKWRIPWGSALVECYETPREYVVMASGELPESHNCDEMGCGTLSHVAARFPKEKKTT